MSLQDEISMFASGRAIELARFQIFAALLIRLIVGQAHRLPERQSRKLSGLPYKFLRVQASTRSRAFSMFSIEFATLNRK